MKHYSSEEIRNVVLVGHGNVGKTSLGESALFVSGAVTRMGSIEEQNTVGDYDEDEHRRKFSLNLAVLPVEWNGVKINFIDTPGYADFVSEVICGVRAADLALIVVDALAGPEVGTDRVWQIAEERGLPRMILVNRLDRENADYNSVLSSLREKWGTSVAPLLLPIGESNDLGGVIDLLAMKAYLGSSGEPSEVPADYQDNAEELRAALIESIVENDEELMAKYFEDEEITAEELNTALRAALAAGEIVPLLCASATQQVGVRQMLDTLVAVAPAPSQREVVDSAGESLEVSEGAPPVVLVFKTSADPYVGRLSYLRVMAGAVKADSHLWNISEGADERLGTIYSQRGKEQEPVDALSPGDIGVVAKLSHTGTGDTLGSKDKPVLLPAMTFPEPVYSMAVRPGAKAAVDKLGPSLQRLLEEDPGLRLRRDASTSETILEGLGDAHLDVAVGRLLQKFNVEVELSLPRVPYRETVGRTSSADYTHKKQSGGHGQYARVSIEIKPLSRGSGLQFNSRVVGGSVPREFIPAVEKGVMETAQEGVVAGYELTDCEVTLFDGKHHPVDSSEMAFKLAANQALKEAVAAAHGVLLEPVMTIRVRTPEAKAGDIVGDLNTKRARIHGIVPDGSLSVVEADVPLSEVQRYASDLRSLTQGRGLFELEFDRYEEVPSNVAQRVIESGKEEPAAAH
ncbi:MAG: elongation factor G [Dehalococcoidia bacterium]|nr:elongation factor G [Dehalococcoidia bacterium]HCU99736.1 elongation factor G [Dehalococcoidia bacterium]